jgi:hypothetical protein
MDDEAVSDASSSDTLVRSSNKVHLSPLQKQDTLEEVGEGDEDHDSDDDEAADSPHGPTAMPFAGSVVVPTRARGQWTKATRKVTIIGAFNHIRSTFGSWRASDPPNRGDEFVVPPADHEDDLALDAMDALTNDITRGFLPTTHHAEEKVEVVGMASRTTRSRP